MQNYLSILLNDIREYSEDMKKCGCFIVVKEEHFPACVHLVVLHGSENLSYSKKHKYQKQG